MRGWSNIEIYLSHNTVLNRQRLGRETQDIGMFLILEMAVPEIHFNNIKSGLWLTDLDEEGQRSHVTASAEWCLDLITCVHCVQIDINVPRSNH